MTSSKGDGMQVNKYAADCAKCDHLIHARKGAGIWTVDMSDGITIRSWRYYHPACVPAQAEGE